MKNLIRDLEKGKYPLVIIRLRDKEFSLPGDLTLAQAFKRLGYTAEGYLAVRDGEIITEDQLLKDGDVIKLVPVISGGSR